ncbi:MAG: DUF2071 domain-containing protein [Actinomycetota bacterium]
MTDAYPAACPTPVRLEVMRMWWRNLVFIHWPFEPSEVQAVLPPGLSVDTIDGAAWVGLVPFEMTVATPGGVTLPKVGVFPETNVRTYVRGPDGRNGVWFSSLEAGGLAATVTARVSYGLPYFWADMEVASAGPYRTYRTTRRWPGPRGATSEAAVSIGSEILVADQSPVERFLTARWGLYSTFGSRLLYAPVSHDPWPLRTAELLHLDDELMGAAGFRIPSEAPLVHWTAGTEVRIGRPSVVGRTDG